MAKIKYPEKFTEADFETMGWHDNYIHAINFEPETYSFSLDIDYIHQWIMDDGDNNFRFAISPARITFNNISNLKLDVDFSGCLPEMSIDRIEMNNQRPTANKKLPEYDFLIVLNWPENGGGFSFSATGFVQRSLAPAAFYEEQKIPAGERAKLLKM